MVNYCAKSMMSTFTNAIILLLLSVNVSGVYKRWRQNTNFGNPDNWSGGRLPCRNDRVRFPASTSPVLVQTNSTVLQIILPSDGELMFAASSSISFQKTPDNSADCPGGEVVYSRSEPKGWMDPESWCFSQTEDGCDRQQELVDAEWLPCQHDDVIFPAGNSFLVKLDFDVTVASLTIYQQKYSTESFKQFLGTDGGRNMFKRSAPSVTVTISSNNYGCTDPTGCACSNFNTKVMQSICSYQNERCSNTSCETPLAAKGTCCKFCGAVMTMEYGAGFKFTTLKKYLEDTFLSPQLKDGSNLLYSMSKLPSGQIQLAVSDSKSGLTATAAAKQIEAFISSDISGNKQFGIASVQVQYSGPSQGPGSPAEQRGIGSGGISGIAIAVLAFLALLALALFCLIDHRRASNAWHSIKKNVSRLSKRSDVETGSTVPSVRFKDQQAYLDDSDHGFDNPTYGVQPLQPFPPFGTRQTSLPDDASGSPMDSPAIILGATELRTSFANPLYSKGPIQEVGPGHDPSLTMNPVFDSHGMEEQKESEI